MNDDEMIERLGVGPEINSELRVRIFEYARDKCVSLTEAVDLFSMPFMVELYGGKTSFNYQFYDGHTEMMTIESFKKKWPGRRIIVMSEYK